MGFLAAKNVVRLAAPRHAVRRLLDVFRGIDQLVGALVFVRAMGLGPLAGVLAIFISDLGTIIIKRFRATFYDQVAFVVLNVLIVVAIIDFLSGRLRGILIGR